PLGSHNPGLVAGANADFIAVELDSVRLASFDPTNGAAHLVHGASASDVRDVWVGGEQIVKAREHKSLKRVSDALREAIGAVL
ncbi:MAG: formimidoylglutamate deiminase, partial [Actinomycetota bacterium]